MKIYGKSPFFRLNFSEKVPFLTNKIMEKVPFLDQIFRKKSLFVAGRKFYIDDYQSIDKLSISVLKSSSVLPL